MTFGNRSRLLSFYETGKWSLAYAWQSQAGILTGILVTALLMGLTPAAMAWVGRGLINALVQLINSGAAHTDIELSAVYPWLAWAMMLALTEAVCTHSSNYLKLRLNDELNLRVCSAVLDQSARLDLSYFENPRAQDVLERVQKNSGYLMPQFIGHLLSSVSQALQLVSLTVVLCLIEPLVVLILLPIVIPYFVVQWRFASEGYQMEYGRAPQRRWSKYYIRLMTQHLSVPEIKIFNLSSLLSQKYQRLLTGFSNENRSFQRRSLWAGLIYTLLATLCVYALFLRVIAMTAEGKLTVGDVAIFSGATLRLRTCLNNLALVMRNLREDIMNLEDLRTFLTTEPMASEPTEALGITPNGVIEFEHVSFCFPNAEEPALVDCSFRIEPGETIGLVGRKWRG